ncbi:hypothetical protein BCR32DRAFT_269782 [Anaeromyces robustus]|uniref:SH3 domain-containing protein n=1 Tax=Anaeromyces robustus TaxID=1754192 RepID=A0A1Y1WZD5_9FUNG|nr:hypothetical protein BCR32DRAFT_269782 [Anaeromyces robustus]|eukprot:ORX78921.1 hypothetical protein BCR32DRAFT_269782 [Anaeromyces robustus]
MLKEPSDEDKSSEYSESYSESYTTSSQSSESTSSNDYSTEEEEFIEGSNANILDEKFMSTFKNKKLVALYDYVGSTDDEISCNQGDEFIFIQCDTPDWWYVKSVADNNVCGYLPRTYVQFVEDIDLEKELTKVMVESNQFIIDPELLKHSIQVKSSKKTEQLIKNILEENKIDMSLSYLSKLRFEGKGSMKEIFMPVLDKTGINFKDLYLDPNTQTLYPIISQCTSAFSLISAKNIPQISTEFDVYNYYVKMALFKNSSLCSNIHNIIATPSVDSPSNWKFSAKSSILFPGDDENTCFVRSNNSDYNMYILFELCVTVSIKKDESNTNNGKNIKNNYENITFKKTNNVADICCGWGLFPLFTPDGGPIENRTYEIKLNSGIPFGEQKQNSNVEKKGIFQSLLGTDKNPRLNIRVWKLGKSMLNEINTLPVNIISFISIVPILSIYRRYLAQILHNMPNKSILEPKFNPVLAIMPKIGEYPELLRYLALVWDYKFKSLKRSEKKQFSVLIQYFKDCVLTVWPLISLLNIDNIDILSSGINLIQQKGPVACLLNETGEFGFKPFDMEELTFDYLNYVEILNERDS